MNFEKREKGTKCIQHNTKSQKILGTQECDKGISVKSLVSS